VTNPIASYQWFGMNAISAGVFGVPIGLLTIWIVSLLTPAPSTRCRSWWTTVRYPVLSGDIETRGT
jgi:cation/acetate symporter